MTMNPAMLLAMFPADLLKPIAANIHLLADALEARDPAGAKKAVETVLENITDYLTAHNIPPERLLEWAQMMGIQIAELDLASLLRSDKTTRN